jgi:acetyl esterase/lipase
MNYLRVLPAMLACCCLGQVPSDVKPNNPPVVPAGATVEANIPYDNYKETVLDILRPASSATGPRRPGVLLIHGGGWTGGTKEGRVEYAAAKYLEQGFVVANVEYRLAKAAPAPAAVSDVLKAADWFRDNAKKYNVDSNRIVVTGDSAGGHLALMVAMTPRSASLGKPAKVAAVVDFYGITDVFDVVQGENERPWAATWVPDESGREDLARRVSPMTYVRKNLPPILLIHGDADETVPYNQSANLTRALVNSGSEARLLTAPGQGHSMPKAKLDELYVHVFAFLKEEKVMD